MSVKLGRLPKSLIENLIDALNIVLGEPPRMNFQLAPIILSDEKARFTP